MRCFAGCFAGCFANCLGSYLVEMNLVTGVPIELLAELLVESVATKGKQLGTLRRVACPTYR